MSEGSADLSLYVGLSSFRTAAEDAEGARRLTALQLSEPLAEVKTLAVRVGFIRQEA